MCGIVGFNWDDKELVKKMAGSIEHRGPDGHGYYNDADISLGHRRLSIIDLSERGKQPMCNEDGTIWITFNGEIYNFKELRIELQNKNHKFSSNTDTEVIVHAYEEYGFDSVEKLDGMFAFAIWDSNKKILFLARDPFGIKPLYYYWSGDKFIFGSEIKAINEANVDKKVNSEAVLRLLQYKFVPTEQTFFSNIYKLLPGQYLIFKDKKINVIQYWDLKNDEIERGKDYVEELKKLLENSVNMHMIADVEVGSFLSGGIDSSIITALAQKNVEKAGKNIKAFTVTFDDFSESKYSKIVAEHVGADYHEFYIDWSKAMDKLDYLMRSYDEPAMDFGIIPAYHLSKFAAKKVKVIVGGEGADEIFAGYNYYNHVNKMRKNLLFFKPLLRKNKFSSLFKFRKLNRAFELKDSLDDFEKFYLGFMSYFRENEIQDALIKKPQVIPVDLDVTKFKDFINKMLYFEIKTSLPEDLLMKTDKMTMLNSLEERVPYLSKSVAEFAFKLPMKMKMRGSNEKYILKLIGKSLLPKEILKRKKIGYGIPYMAWIRQSDFGKVIKNRLENSKKITNYINKDYLNKILLNYRISDHYLHQLWTFYSFERWLETNGFN